MDTTIRRSHSQSCWNWFDKHNEISLIKISKVSIIIIYIRDSHVTLTHVVIKAVAECINVSKKKICGKIVFGKFIEFPTIDISCLVNIGEGDDLAALLV